MPALPPDPIDHPAISEPLRALARRGEPRRYRKGTLLIQEGDVGDTLYIILAGRLRAFGSSPETEREITYDTYGIGDLVGEMGLDGGPRSASVIALEDSLCAVITRPTLERHIAEHPPFAFLLIEMIIGRARAATAAAKRMALNDVYGRLKLLLESLAEPQPDGTRLVRERHTHQELANRIGCTREMVSRVMKELEVGGYVVAASGAMVLAKGLPARW